MMHFYRETQFIWISRKMYHFQKIIDESAAKVGNSRYILPKVENDGRQQDTLLKTYL